MSISSNTASMTMSASGHRGKIGEPCINPLRRSISAALKLPRLTEVL